MSKKTIALSKLSNGASHEQFHRLLSSITWLIAYRTIFYKLYFFLLFTLIHRDTSGVMSQLIRDKLNLGHS